MIIYTVKEIANILKLDVELIMRLLNRKELEYIKVCDRIRITENQFKEFIKKKENKVNNNIFEIKEEKNNTFQNKRSDDIFLDLTIPDKELFNF